MEIGTERDCSSNCSLESERLRSCAARSRGRKRRMYLSVHHGVFTVDNDLARRRNHERRHHGRRLLPAHGRGAICRGRGQVGCQLHGHRVYGRVIGRLCSMRSRRGAARVEDGWRSAGFSHVLSVYTKAGQQGSGIVLDRGGLPYRADCGVFCADCRSLPCHRGRRSADGSGSVEDAGVSITQEALRVAERESHVGRGHNTWATLAAA